MSQFEYHNAANDEASQKKSLAWMLANTSGKASTGVLSGLAVAQTATASASVTIDAGAGVVQAATLDGASLLGQDTLLTLDVLTANPVGGLPRNDIVVFDLATLTPVSGTATGGIRVVVGTPNASPTDPTVPTSAIPLARLRHAASATTVPAAKIDDLRTFTSLFAQAATWVSYTPTWTADTTNPAVGTGGSIVGSYLRIGNEIEATITVTLGTSGTSGGAGAYKLSLPVAADTTKEISGRAVYTVAGGGTHILFPSFSTSSAFRLLSGTAPATVWATTVPETITASTTVKVRVRYTAA